MPPDENQPGWNEGVKHDHSPGVMYWSRKILGLLGIIGGLCAGVGIVFLVWRSFGLVGRGLTISTSVGVVGALVRGWFMLTGKEEKQPKRVEALRRKPEEAALYPIQPDEINEMKCSLPLILSMQVSLRFSLGCLVFLVAVGGACTAPLDIFLHVADWESVVIGWMVFIILLGIVLSLVGILIYQRIEATEQGLSVQTGLKRRTIAWEQAKLFAALRLNDPDGEPTRYEISSARTILRWDGSNYQLGAITVPRDRQEYEQRHRDLLSCIHLHTGLPLLDLR